MLTGWKTNSSSQAWRTHCTNKNISYDGFLWMFGQNTEIEYVGLYETMTIWSMTPVIFQIDTNNWREISVYMPWNNIRIPSKRIY